MKAFLAFLIHFFGGSQAAVRLNELADLSIEVRTYDSLVTDYQDLFFGLDYKNSSDSINVISELGSLAYIPKVGIAADGDTLWIGQCPDFSLSVPARSRFFILCPINVGADLWMKFGNTNTAQFVAKVNATGVGILVHSISIRFAPPTNSRLHEFIEAIQSRIQQHNSSARSQSRAKTCNEYITEYSAIPKNELRDELLIVTAKRYISRFICLHDMWDTVPQIFAPNWPSIQSRAKCLANGTRNKGNTKCLLAERDVNFQVAKLIGLTKPLQTTKAPYKFLAGTDTVYVAWSTWIPQAISPLINSN